jgi:hypothetical protein
MSSRILRTRWALAVAERNGTARMKKELWTEAELIALSQEENDAFERKSGRLSEDTGKFLDALAKALSAFANSGGGHLIIGVEDDGSLTGIDPFLKKEPIRDWLEQKIPGLLDYALSDFRVHTVVPAADTNIPEGKIVIVVDVGDSALAPHQSKRDKFYYHRSAGRSVPASHFYLDLLRQRLASPDLKFHIDDVSVVNSKEYEEGIFVYFKVKFIVENCGRVAAYKWGLTPRSLHHPDNKIFPFVFFGENNFPVLKSENSSISIDDTILPGHSRYHTEEIGITFRPERKDEEAIERSLVHVVRDLGVTYKLATEMSPGEPTLISIFEKLNINKCLDQMCSAAGLGA